MEGIIKMLHDAEVILVSHYALETPPGMELNRALERSEDILRSAADMCLVLRTTNTSTLYPLLTDD